MAQPKLDFTTAWLIQSETELEHHLKCSSVQTNGAMLCDCGAVVAEFARLHPPKRGQRKKKLPKIISRDEAKVLLQAADDGSAVGPRNQLMFELMYRAGLRVSEVTKLKPRDVGDGIIRVYDAKGGDGTAYYDPARVEPLLESWLLERAAWIGELGAFGDAPLFIWPDGRPVNTRYLQRLIKKLKVSTGIAGICTPHVLRHTYATELLEDDLNIVEVQKAVRHANLQTTEIYLHVRDDALRRKISQRGKRREVYGPEDEVRPNT